MSEESDARIGTKINHNTTITVGLLVVVVSAALAIAGMFNAAQNDLKIIRLEFSASHEKAASELRVMRLEINQALSQLQSRIDSNAGDRWTWSDMRRWAREFKQANPSLSVPDPEHKQ